MKYSKSNATIRGHALLPQSVRQQLPALYATDDKGDQAIVRVKFFTPDSQWTWYATEFDGNDTFFGFVIGHSAELGYFSLSELENARGPWGLPIERDLSFRPTPLGEIRKQHQD